MAKNNRKPEALAAAAKRLGLPEIPPHTKLVFEVRGVNRETDGWWVSPWTMDRDRASWSHDRDFPMRLESVAQEADVLRWFAAGMVAEWQQEMDYVPNGTPITDLNRMAARVDGVIQEWEAVFLGEGKHGR